jgi:dTDP-4-dehydrorhamnose reductase
MAMAEILLVSPDGMLGRAFATALQQRATAFEAVSYPSFDITDPEHVARALHPGIRMVINCSAYTDVDGAEKQEDAADAVNYRGVQLLAARCRELSALLVHYSTDFVFDGEASAPYRTTDAKCPPNAYGRSKARGEEAILASGCQSLIIRTSWLYAPWGKNFVDTMARLGLERPKLRVVDDQRGRPSSAQYLATRSLALIDCKARGIFHVTDGGECTKFELARAIVAECGGKAVVEPCSSAEFPLPARRPSYSVLDLSSTEALIGPSRPWLDNLKDVLAERGK